MNEKVLLAAIVTCLKLGPDLTDATMAASASRVMPDIPPEDFRRALARVRRGIVLVGADGTEFGRWPPEGVAN